MVKDSDVETLVAKYGKFSKKSEDGKNVWFACNQGTCQWAGTRSRLVEHIAGVAVNPKVKDVTFCICQSREARAASKAYVLKKREQKEQAIIQEKREQANLKISGTKLAAQRTILDYARLSNHDRADRSFVSF